MLHEKKKKRRKKKHRGKLGCSSAGTQRSDVSNRNRGLWLYRRTSWRHVHWRPTARSISERGAYAMTTSSWQLSSAHHACCTVSAALSLHRVVSPSPPCMQSVSRWPNEEERVILNGGRRDFISCLLFMFNKKLESPWGGGLGSPSWVSIMLLLSEWVIFSYWVSFSGLAAVKHRGIKHRRVRGASTLRQQTFRWRSAQCVRGNSRGSAGFSESLINMHGWINMSACASDSNSAQITWSLNEIAQNTL